MLARHSTLVTDFTDTDPPCLRQALSTLTDPRRRRGARDPFGELLLMFTAAVISGQSTLTRIAEWAADASARGNTLPTTRTAFHLVHINDEWRIASIQHSFIAGASGSPVPGR
ncbi:MAG: transposase family protein [Brevibacterium sp.]